MFYESILNLKPIISMLPKYDLQHKPVNNNSVQIIYKFVKLLKL